MSSIFDEFTLSPNTSSGNLIPDGPEIIDKTGDAPIGEQEVEVIEPNNKSVKPKSVKDESSEKSGEEIASKKGSEKSSSQENSNESSEESDEDESGSQEEGRQEGSEESNEVDLLPFAEELYEQLGFEGKFDSKEFIEEFGGKGVESIIKFAKTVIDENSKVIHPNEEAEKYYNYVANGGDPKKLSYLLDVEASYENIKVEDLADDETLTKGVLRSYLKEQNPKKDEKWIDSKIQKYIDSGIAVEEAAEALEDLKSISKEKTQEAVKAQESVVKEERKRQEKHWEDIQILINSSERIAGVKLDKAGKEKFFSSLKNGAYNKYISDTKNAVELAMVAHLGGFEKAMEKVGTTKATNKLEASLSRHVSKGVKVKSQTMPQSPESGGKVHFTPGAWSLT